MIELMAIGILCYLILTPIIGYLIDNSGDIDIDEENRLTGNYK